ncbi:low affinity iron permease family protein [Roseicella aerolata]|uniref:Low affinity iron permease family protein n=1 Tax=Roseicella aerolata TaxID=2883479 RepID=A0A9X1L968_9PROT|nr:low affinity iron permease family protein [Roseicella aerolata]MCB4823314.1 low affinity iron permease family protein [Roseicella aerolata]
MRLSTLFARLAHWASCQAGRPWAFSLALAVVLAWAVSGPLFGFSDTWQLVINTGTTVVTFLMVFLIQHAQNRDTQAIQLKLDELIRATHGAHNRLIALEEKSEEELARARAELHHLAEPHHRKAPHAHHGTETGH